MHGMFSRTKSLVLDDKQEGNETGDTGPLLQSCDGTCH